MLGYRRKSFMIAFDMLRELSADTEKLDVLFEFQELLISEIIATEEKIHGLKSELKSIPLTGRTTEEQKRTEYLERRIDRVRQVRHVWKSFGDAIAFTYLDSFSLKQTHYNTHNTNPKQDAGFIGKKNGLSGELTVLKEILGKGIPCMLVDLTDTVRYGDVCILVGPDPLLIEVKSSGRLNARARKQIKNIEKLHSFYETDVASHFRGMDQIRRVEHEAMPESYVAELNECLNRAYTDGHSISQPEPGYFIVAITDDNIPTDKIFESIKIEKPWITLLNEFKSNRNWAPYCPYTLSIHSERAVYDFIQGNLIIMVLLDCKVVSEVAVQQGYTVDLNFDDQEYPLRLTKDGTEGRIGISKHILMRSFLEFLSPAWIIRRSLEGFEKRVDEIELDTK